jgi:phage terminase large subunit-like protein
MVPWKTFSPVCFGLSLCAQQATLAQRCTGRQAFPTRQAQEAVLIIGRRGGKSRMAALCAVYIACFRSYATVLSPGEKGVVMLLASDRRQARVLKQYVSGLLRSVPMLEQMIANETSEGIELDNGIVIEVHTASFRSVRGYTIVAAIPDEIAFWDTDDSANPDTEILNALRPAMATVPGALLRMISSPLCPPW